jgi:hypothetical protein
VRVLRRFVRVAGRRVAVMPSSSVSVSAKPSAVLGQPQRHADQRRSADFFSSTRSQPRSRLRLSGVAAQVLQVLDGRVGEQPPHAAAHRLRHVDRHALQLALAVPPGERRRRCS